MFYLHNLRVRLQERRNRLYKTGYRTYDGELLYLLQFLDGNQYTRSLLNELEVSTAVDFEQWVSEQGIRNVPFPQSEAGRAKVCYNILKTMRELMTMALSGGDGDNCSVRKQILTRSSGTSPKQLWTPLSTSSMTKLTMEEISFICSNDSS